MMRMRAGVAGARGAGVGFGIDTLATTRTLVFERRAADHMEAVEASLGL